MFNRQGICGRGCFEFPTLRNLTKFLIQEVLHESRLRFLFRLLLYFFLLHTPFLFAQTKERITIAKLNGEIELDGLSNETAWKTATRLPMVMHIPNYGSQPTEKTEVLLLYDEKYLYIAAKLYDSDPGQIHASSMKRDDFNNSSDMFGVIIDSYHDRENALSFFTQPSGLRTDFTVFNDAQSRYPINLSWNTFWDVVTKVTDEGWFAEFRIPFSSLRFQEKNGEVSMGLIALRWIARKSESAIFPAIPHTWGWWSQFKPSMAGTIVFKGIHDTKPLYVTPYVLGGLNQTQNFDPNENTYAPFDEFTREAGLDVKYSLTSNLTLDLSLNTDFAQVEADDELINLTRFSLFYPEKRMFFQERSSIFDFNTGGVNRLFYSRRIGLIKGKPVRIFGGARMIGRVDDWDVGFLDMQTQAIDTIPSENFGVFRLRRQLFNPYSHVGGMITSRVGVDGSYNVNYGLDAIIRVFGDDYLTLNWVQTFENDAPNDPLSLDPTFMRLNWERRSLEGFNYDVSFARSGNNYNPGMGFERRYNYTRFGDRVLYGWLPTDSSLLLRHQGYLDGSIYLRNSDGTTESADFGPGWDFTFKTGALAGFLFKMNYESLRKPFYLSPSAMVNTGDYTFYDGTIYCASPDGGLFYSLLSLTAGTFYDGWNANLNLIARWSISSSLELSSNYSYYLVKFPDRNQEFIAHVPRVRVLYMFNTDFSATTFAQYNSAIDGIILNVRVRYNPREGNDLYLVYNEDFNTNRYDFSPVLPFSNSRAILVKYTYTFSL